MLDDLSLFVSIIQAGSLQKAAMQMNMPASTLSRRLQKLEAHLGCKLLNRSSRGITLTREGKNYFDQCQPLLAMLAQNIEDLHQNTTQPSGTIRVLAPINLSIFMANFWRDFLQNYPDISLVLQLNNRNDNFLQQGADLALRIGKQNDSGLIQKRLASVETGIVATQTYLNKHPKIKHPADLLRQHWLVAQPLSKIVLTNQQSGEVFKLNLSTARFQVNEISLCIALAKQHLGLTYVPKVLCQTELKKGQLINILPKWQMPKRDIYAVYNAQQQLPMRVRVLYDALADFFH
ncbi:MAG: LysR family transcriptional regulator [Gammaproteobacteria bacterium]|nr:MAG: LysR family transcriptional regulator [Gammaproteobacteria bacterium]